MKYQGLRENGEWEQFEVDSREDATPEKTGYEKVKDSNGEEINN